MKEKFRQLMHFFTRSLWRVTEDDVSRSRYTGYNLLKSPIIVTVTWNGTDDEAGMWTVAATSKGVDGVDETINATLADNMFSINVVNQAGVTLPSTGGIGTTIFYVVGGLLVLAAVVLLVTKRRMNSAA